MSVGDSVRQGQVIALRDTVLEEATLKMEYERDAEYIQAELMKLELRLSSARRELEELQKEKSRLEGQVARFSSEPLLIKERIRIEERLARVSELIQTESEQIGLLSDQAKQFEDRARHRSAKLASDLAIVKEKAEVLARVLRVECCALSESRQISWRSGMSFISRMARSRPEKL